MLLMIDNYDSFTYNLVQYLGELGEDVKVVRNDEWSVDQVAAANPELDEPGHSFRGAWSPAGERRARRAGAPAP